MPVSTTGRGNGVPRSPGAEECLGLASHHFLTSVERFFPCILHPWVDTVIFFSSLEDIIRPVVYFLPCVPKCSLILAENVLSEGRLFIPLAYG